MRLYGTLTPCKVETHCCARTSFAVRRLLPLLALVLALTAAPVAAGKAAVPCRDRVYNDWYADGKIATTYPLSCYRSALAHLNGSADLTVYSSLGDDIRLALAAAVRRQHHELAPREVGKGFTIPNSRTPASANADPSSRTTTTKSSALHPGQRPTPESLDHTATAADSSAAAVGAGSSGGTPVPLLVLGGIALALVAAGGVGAGIRRTRRQDPS
jgi:hypothetical protein